MDSKGDLTLGPHPLFSTSLCAPLKPTLLSEVSIVEGLSVRLLYATTEVGQG